MSGNQVRVGFGITGASKAASDMDKLKDKFTKLQSTTAKGFITGVGAGIGLSAVSAVGTAISDVTGFLHDSVDAYREEEVAQAKETTALNQNIPAWKAHADAIKDATEASVNLGFTDNETTDSLAKLFAATGDVNEALKILGAAQDLARFKGISLADATDALTKVEGGSFRILKSLGINLKAGATEADALAAVMRVAGGQARSFANTDLGAVAIETAKVDEAQEKFGKGLSKLEVAILPAVGDAMGALGDEVEALGTAFDKTAPPAAKVDGLLALLNDLGGRGMPIIGGLVGHLQELSGAQHDAATYAGEHGDELAGVRTAMRGLTDAEVAAQDPTADLTDRLKEEGDALDRIHGYANTAADALRDFEAAEFGGAIMAGDLADAQKGLADKLADPPKKGTQAYTIWAGEVAAAKQRVFDLQYQMAQAKGPQALYDWLEKQRDKLAANDKKGRDYLNTLIALASLNLPNVKGNFQITTTGTGRYGGKPVPLAEGGIVKAKPGGTLAVIGEGGHDEAVVPLGKSGTVTGARSTGAWGGTTELHFHFPNAYGMTPAQARMLAREVAPIITREQQRHGHLAGARAF